MHEIKETLTLPWPPTTNRCWRYVNGMTLLSREARRYRKTVRDLLLSRKTKTYLCRLSLYIKLYPPNKRKFDIDNRAKILIDSLQDARVFADDNQIDLLTLERGEPVKGGFVTVLIKELPCLTQDSLEI